MTMQAITKFNLLSNAQLVGIHSISRIYFDFVADNPLHPNIFCDICGCPIRGVRFKCAVCRDYDLCEDCDDDETHTEHPMIKIHIPEPRWKVGRRQYFITF